MEWVLWRSTLVCSSGLPYVLMDLMTLMHQCFVVDLATTRDKGDSLSALIVQVLSLFSNLLSVTGSQECHLLENSCYMMLFVLGIKLMWGLPLAEWWLVFAHLKFPSLAVHQAPPSSLECSASAVSGSLIIVKLYHMTIVLHCALYALHICPTIIYYYYYMS